MKTSILYLIFLLLCCSLGNAQLIIDNSGSNTNEIIQQIRTPNIQDILSFHSYNQGISNNAIIQQVGNQNMISVNQQNSAKSDLSNQSYTIQTGNSNEMTIGQIGNGNLLLGFQLGYLTLLSGSGSGNGIIGDNNMLTTNGSENVLQAVGERNKLSIVQSGNNNGVMAVQQGTDNSFSVDQTGENNYLFALQKGSFNMVTGYLQQNQSKEILYEKIIQIGDYNSLKTSDVSLQKPAGNIFTQTGVNLSLEVNNSLLNNAGGVEIHQSGNNMTVVIDQSFFSFPMK